MRTNNEHISPVKALLQSWRALGLRAVLHAREVSLCVKIDPARGVIKAEMLEVWLRFALLTLVGELARLNADGEDHAQYSDEIQHLRQIAAALAGTLIIVARMKRQCLSQLGFAGRNECWSLAASGWPSGDVRILSIPFHTADAFPAGRYFDSS